MPLLQADSVQVMKEEVGFNIDLLTILIIVIAVVGVLWILKMVFDQRRKRG
ncbi:MAG: hypothetical protein HKN32_06175 [Flavobacteriales bacterium]|nr:hypothetical protein [Flavobacteriales bacterium]